MMEKLEGHKRYLFISATIIALGITFTTILKDTVGAIGIVFIATGGLLFIIGMRKKQKEMKRKTNNERTTKNIVHLADSAKIEDDSNKETK